MINKTVMIKKVIFSFCLFGSIQLLAMDGNRLPGKGVLSIVKRLVAQKKIDTQLKTTLAKKRKHEEEQEHCNKKFKADIEKIEQLEIKVLVKPIICDQNLRQKIEALKAMITAFKEEKTVENIADKIRNVDDTILHAMEAAGGHTLKEHVGKTHRQLKRRISKNFKVQSSSTFIDEKTATDAVAENLKHNSHDIASWLMANPSPCVKKTFYYSHAYKIGNGKVKGKGFLLEQLTTSKIVLTPTSDNKLGFAILSAYPLIDRKELALDEPVTRIRRL